MTFELKDLNEEQQLREQEIDQINLSLCLDSIVHTITMKTIRSGVFREGEFTVNRWEVKDEELAWTHSTATAHNEIFCLQ